MIVEFEGRFSQKRQDLICSAIGFAAEKLFPSEDAVYINIQAINKEGLCGDVMFEDDKDFTIRLNRTLSITDLITTVLHELVHVSQYLKYLVMDLDSDYENRWQEIEAHAMEKELLKEYLSGSK
mgnify:CR=1 FL=1|jgi:hypothetical protein|tara:strand:- start:1229 stop:1600 length:372 start_codon:yes stop_codon:yes gene_type:complete